MGTSARIEELRKKFDENPRRYFAPLANEYRKAGDLEQAIEICRQHLAEQPTHMSGHIVFGQALYEATQLDEAQQVFTQALGLDPENLIALRHLGDIAQAQGNPAGARDWYQRVLDADPRNEEIAALVRELASAVPVEGFAGLPADGAAGETAEMVPAESAADAAAEAPLAWEPLSPEAAPELPAPDGIGAPPAPLVDPDAETVQFVPPRLSSMLDLPELPDLPEPPKAPEVPELPAFASLDDAPAETALPVRPASALPPENIVEPLPETIELTAVDAQRLIEEVRAARETPVADFVPTALADLEMPSAEELRRPSAPPPPAADPLADLPMEMLEDYGNASAESLLGSGAPAPASPLEALESGLGTVDDPTPLIGGGMTDGALEFMDNPLGDLAAATSAPADAASALDGLMTLDDGNAFAPEPPLPPPTPPQFEPVDSVEPQDAPTQDAPMQDALPPRAPTPAGGVPFVTETMGEVLEAQGLHAQAADVYRTLLDDRPGDARLSAKLAAVEEKLGSDTPNVVTWLQQLASGRLASAAAEPAPAAPIPAAPAPAAPAPAAPAPVAEAVPAVGAPVAVAEPDAPMADASAAASLDALFGAATHAGDLQAAAVLAALFEEAAVLPGAPTAPAADELSLKAVFEPPAAPAPRTSAAFSFDQFFAAAPKSSTPAPGANDPELAEFTRWLDGLKKQ